MTDSLVSSLSAAAGQHIVQVLAAELKIRPDQVSSTVAMLDGGATVPFIARYRKEATGDLDDTTLRTLDERLIYLRELEARRATILASIEEQGKLTDALRDAVGAGRKRPVTGSLNVLPSARLCRKTRKKMCWPAGNSRRSRRAV